MKKSDIVAHVAGDASLSKAQAQSAVDAVFEAIREALGNGDTVSVTGFGTFSTKSRRARMGRNPRTGESMAIPASKAPLFKAGKTLRDGLRQGLGGVKRSGTTRS